MQMNRILKKVKFDMSSSINLNKLGILTKLFCTSVPNLVVLAWMGDKFKPS